MHREHGLVERLELLGALLGRAVLVVREVEVLLRVVDVLALLAQPRQRVTPGLLRHGGDAQCIARARHVSALQVADLVLGVLHRFLLLFLRRQLPVRVPWRPPIARLVAALVAVRAAV